MSRATIDRVIHKRGDIGEETTKRVLEFLDQVGYVPNKVGRNLAKRTEKHIRVLFHDEDNPFYQDVRAGAEAAGEDVRDFGYFVHLHSVRRNPKEQLELFRRLVAEGGADAVALSPFDPESFRHAVAEAADRRVPLVLFNNDIPDSGRLLYVGANYRQSGRLAGEVLAKHVQEGEVAVLSRYSDYWHNRDRIAGFRETLEGYSGIRIAEERPECKDRESAYACLKQLLEARPELRGCFAADNDEGIIDGLCRAVRESGRKDFCLITLDLNEECRRGLKEGVITATIGQDPFAQGYYAVKLLYRLLSDNKLPKRRECYTKLEVIYRENLDNAANNAILIQAD